MKEKRFIQFNPPDISEHEIEEVTAALRSGWITTGPRTKLLERRLAAFMETGLTDVDCNSEENINKYSNKTVCLNSATAAEELNLRIWGIREGDEVIVPAYTYTATASAVIHCGAKVVFVDIQKDGNPKTRMPEIDYDMIEKAITENTKAIVAVDIGGVVCDYDKIFEIVKRKSSLFKPLNDHSSKISDLSSKIQASLGRIAVMADCAHSLGSSRIIGGERKYCGKIADFSSFSFHAVKNLTTAEGGVASWRGFDGVDDAEIYRMYQLLSLHGQNKDALARTKVGAWEYDILGPWYKFNMTDVAAAMGLGQLDRYLGIIKKRGSIMEKYNAVCDELGVSYMIHHTEDMDSCNHLYLTRIPNIAEAQRNELIKKLAEDGVMTNVHYKPLPMMTAYGADCSKYPNSYDYFSNLITLPSHTLLTDDDVDYVCETFKNLFK